MNELCDLDHISALLNRSGFRFSKSMGQNFLTADWVPERVVSECGAGRENCVLEIGPGIGCLTRPLSEKAGKVVAVELDRRLIPILEETLAECGNVEIVRGDIMKIDLAELVAGSFAGLSPTVCSNLPYGITTPALTKLMESGLFRTITVMVQQEVAKRLCAAAGSPEYGAFTLFTEYYAKARILFDVPPECFVPRPKITSAVVRLETRALPPVDCDRDTLFRIVRAAFGQRRKTLLNSLSAAFGNISKSDTARIITSAGISPDIRGEKLTLEDFSAIAAAADGIL